MRARVLLAVVSCAAGCTLFVDTSGFSEDVPSSPAAGAIDASPDGSTGTDGAAPDVAVDAPVALDGSTLVADWPFREGSGTAVNDESGHGHNAIALGGVWVGDRASAPGNALAFDGGANDYVSVAPHTDFDRGAAAQLTMMVWVRFDETPSHDLVLNVSYGGQDAAYGIEVHSATSMNYWDGTNHVAQSTIPNVVGTWHHFGVVVDGVQAHVYFDGVRVGTGTADVTPRVATQVLFGRSTYGDHLAGAVDQARFFRAALSDAEMMAEKNR